MKLNVSTQLPAVRVKVKEATCIPPLSRSMPITLPYTEIMEINAQEEITWKRQNKQLPVQQIYFPSYYTKRYRHQK